MKQASEPMAEKPDTDRLFIGASLPGSFLEQIAAMRTRWEGPPGIRWTPEDQLHLTVMFLGNVPHDILENLIRLFSDGYRQTSQVRLEAPHWTWGPDLREARMLWMRFRAAAEFRQLVRESQHWFGQIQPYPQQRKSPVPHVTIGRFRPQTFDPFTPLPSSDIKGSLILDKLTLWKSDLSKNGPDYTPLAHFPLRSVGQD